MNEPVEVKELAELKEGDMVLVWIKNGGLLAGPWKGTVLFQNEPIVTVGKRTEYFRSVLQIKKVTETKEVFNREVEL